MDPNSPWKGKVWSFRVPARKAYEPVPGDGTRFVDTDVTLTWTTGFGARTHAVYFGDDFDAVNNATGAPGLPFTTYTPGALELDKTYYWRIDETDEVLAVHKGDVWSFRTAKIGGGIKGEYFNNMDLSGMPVLTRTDPQIDFYWDPGPVGPGVNEDNFSVRWTGELEAAFSEPVTFITGSDDGVRLYLDGELIIDDWNDHDRTETISQPIELVAGQSYTIVLEGYENAGEAEWQLYWRSPSIPRQIVPQGALSPPIKASSASPPNGATGVKMIPTLTWSPGDYAVSHQVYFGTDEDAVKDATAGSPEDRGTRALGDESFEPGKLAWDSVYYWRIDEVNNLHPDSPWTGSVWSFSTGDFLVVDNMEDYDLVKQIWWNWLDGLGYVDLDGVFHAGNGSGSEVGDPDSESTTEETIVNNGDQSIPYWYNNSGSTGKFNYSEAKLTLTAPRDWTEEAVKALSLWFQGFAASVGSLVESPPGTYTMTGSGADITGQSDEFHYAYKMLNGAGTIIARVESQENTSGWAKAGVMIRDTLEAGSAHAMSFVTPGDGAVTEYRPAAGQDNVGNAGQIAGVTAPYWVRLERDLGQNFTASASVDGVTWQPLGAGPATVSMNANVYVGLAVSAGNASATCEAVFSNVTISGNVTGQWQHQDIGIQSNDPEPMYVAIANSTGQPAVVYHDDPDAVQIDTWTEWNIDLNEFRDKGINLADVDSVAIGFGDRNNPQAGGSGKMFFDDLRLYRPRCVPDEVTLSAADLNSDCVVDYRDLEIMVDDWLAGVPGLAGDLNADDTVDFKDYAVLAGQWLEEQLWPQP
jgi:hypothetical protein